MKSIIKLRVRSTGVASQSLIVGKEIFSKDDSQTLNVNEAIVTPFLSPIISKNGFDLIFKNPSKEPIVYLKPNTEGTALLSAEILDDQTLESATRFSLVLPELTVPLIVDNISNNKETIFSIKDLKYLYPSFESKEESNDYVMWNRTHPKVFEYVKISNENDIGRTIGTADNPIIDTFNAHKTWTLEVKIDSYETALITSEGGLSLKRKVGLDFKFSARKKVNTDNPTAGPIEINYNNTGWKNMDDGVFEIPKYPRYIHTSEKNVFDPEAWVDNKTAGSIWPISDKGRYISKYDEIKNQKHIFSSTDYRYKDFATYGPQDEFKDKNYIWEQQESYGELGWNYIDIPGQYYVNVASDYTYTNEIFLPITYEGKLTNKWKSRVFKPLESLFCNDGEENLQTNILSTYLNGSGLIPSTFEFVRKDPLSPGEYIIRETQNNSSPVYYYTGELELSSDLNQARVFKIEIDKETGAQSFSWVYSFKPHYTESYSGEDYSLQGSGKLTLKPEDFVKNKNSGQDISYDGIKIPSKTNSIEFTKVWGGNIGNAQDSQDYSSSIQGSDLFAAYDPIGYSFDSQDSQYEQKPIILDITSNETGINESGGDEDNVTPASLKVNPLAYLSLAPYFLNSSLRSNRYFSNAIFYNNINSGSFFTFKAFGETNTIYNVSFRIETYKLNSDGVTYSTTENVKTSEVKTTILFKDKNEKEHTVEIPLPESGTFSKVFLLLDRVEKIRIVPPSDSIDAQTLLLLSDSIFVWLKKTYPSLYTDALDACIIDNTFNSQVFVNYIRDNLTIDLGSSASLIEIALTPDPNVITSIQVVDKPRFQVLDKTGQINYPSPLAETEPSYSIPKTLYEKYVKSNDEKRKIRVVRPERIMDFIRRYRELINS